MSPVAQTVNSAVSSTARVAFNPVVTGALILVLTKAPVGLRQRLFNVITSLKDERRLGTTLRTLKWLFALGLLGRFNKKLNALALNRWRLRSEKKRYDWNKEVAVVTGGCSGIGMLVVKGLVRKGVRVAVLDIQQLPAQLQGYAAIRFFACDITDPKAVYSTAQSVRDTFGAPSILVNNAGIGTFHSILDTTDEWSRKIFDVNVISNFYTVKAFLPDMVKANKGHVVTVASSASFVAPAGLVDYCATKAAMFAFHEGLNRELRFKYNAPNVLTTSVHPGWVRTPLIQPFEADLRKAGWTLLEPSNVASAIVDQILKCEGAQLFIPERISRVSFLRSWPNWLQEVLRGTSSSSMLKTA